MPDVFTKDKRSEVMSRIRWKGNESTELNLLRLFQKHGITGWRRHQRLIGKPDFIFPKERLAVFVDGCFWHGCPKCYKSPKTNRKFWVEKLEQNRIRDKRVSRQLRAQGWSVSRIWECKLKNPEVTIGRIRRMLAYQEH